MFLHGYLDCKDTFLAQIEYFSRFYRVTAVDFVGFGQSGRLNAPFSVGDYAEWLQEVLELLTVKNPHVIAHSFGCRVAVKAAGTGLFPMQKLILTGPAGVVLRRGLRYRYKVASYRFCRRFAPRFAEKHFGSAEYRGLSPMMKESYKKIVNEDLLGCARMVQNPVLIVEGREDKVTPRRAAEAYLAAFPQAKMQMIEGGHFAFMEDPLAFNLLAEEFLNG